MIPQGPVFLRIRDDVLSSFPNARLSTRRNRTVTFSDWLLNGSGSYVVNSVSSKTISIHASKLDLSASVALEIELLTNHCFEQLVEILWAAQDDRERSDAWNVVTIYYFGFFAASIFLRLVGRPLLYADKARIASIQSLATTVTSPAGPGAFGVSEGANVSATLTEFQLHKSSLKVHEGTWNRVFLYIESLLSDGTIVPTAQELLFYKSISHHSLDSVYGVGWPSNLRNRTNYRAGFAYQGVERLNVTKSKRLISGWADFDESRFLKTLSNSAASCTPVDEKAIAAHVNFMYALSQSVFMLARDLYHELLSRGILEPHWEQRRRKFKEPMSIPESLSNVFRTF